MLRCLVAASLLSGGFSLWEPQPDFPIPLTRGSKMYYQIYLDRWVLEHNTELTFSVKLGRNEEKHEDKKEEGEPVQEDPKPVANRTKPRPPAKASADIASPAKVSAVIVLLNPDQAFTLRTVAREEKWATAWQKEKQKEQVLPSMVERKVPPSIVERQRNWPSVWRHELSEGVNEVQVKLRNSGLQVLDLYLLNPNGASINFQGSVGVRRPNGQTHTPWQQDGKLVSKARAMALNLFTLLAWLLFLRFALKPSQRTTVHILLTASIMIRCLRLILENMQLYSLDMLGEGSPYGGIYPSGLGDSPNQAPKLKNMDYIIKMLPVLSEALDMVICFLISHGWQLLWPTISGFDIRLALGIALVEVASGNQHVLCLHEHGRLNSDLECGDGPVFRVAFRVTICFLVMYWNHFNSNALYNRLTREKVHPSLTRMYNLAWSYQLFQMVPIIFLVCVRPGVWETPMFVWYQEARNVNMQEVTDWLTCVASLVLFGPMLMLPASRAFDLVKFKESDQPSETADRLNVFDRRMRYRDLVQAAEQVTVDGQR